MTARRSLLVLTLIPLLVAALLSALLVTFSATPAFSAPKPQNDHATMPRDCVAPKDLIPQKPTI